MHKYLVTINVDGIWLMVENNKRLMGYYQVFKIIAASVNEASSNAITMVQSDEQILSMWLNNEQIKPPDIFVDEIVEVIEFDDEIKGDCSGRSFYQK